MIKFGLKEFELSVFILFHFISMIIQKEKILNVLFTFIHSNMNIDLKTFKKK